MAKAFANLGEIPQKMGAPKPLVLKSFSRETAPWDSSLPVTLIFESLLTLFSGPLRPFRHFFGTPAREAREDLFETLGGVLGSEGLGTPAYGGPNRNSCVKGEP